MQRTPRAGIAGLVIATLVLGMTPAPVRAQSAPLLTLPSVPWFIGTNVSPNILLTLDDSGSMAWAYAPDAVGNTTNIHRSIAFKSNLNPMYYNEDVTYDAPPNASDIPYSNSFAAAKRNGFDNSRGTINLANGYRPDLSYNPSATSSTQTWHCRGSIDYVDDVCPGVGVKETVATRAYWWRYVPNGTTCPWTPTHSDWQSLPRACFVFKQPAVNSAEETNFANWYSFYRTRNLAVVSATMLGFSKMPQDFRIAWQALNSCQASNFSSNCVGWNNSRPAVNARIGVFNASKRADMWSWLERLPASGGTPLRSAVIRAGEYLKLTGANSPYADTIGSNTTTFTSCRSSYNVALTDGIWNSDSISAYGNADNTPRAMPDNKGADFNFKAEAPYRDSNSNSIADISFHYWANDLQPDLANTLKPFMPFQAGPTVTPEEYWDPRNDPATWQKMNSIYVGLGLSSWLTNPAWGGSTFAGTATPATGYQSFKQGLVNWPTAASDSTPGNVYDLWHASINARGAFYAADSPDALVKAFDDLRNRISQREMGASAASSSSLQVQSDTMMFSTSFNSQRWDGTLRGYKVGADGITQSAPTWSTDSTFNQRVNGGIGSHKVYVRASGGGLMQLLPTTISSLPADRQTELQAQVDVLNMQLTTPIDTAGLLKWVLGDISNEELRRRDRLLGDVVNSAPLYEGGRDYGYSVTGWTDSPRIDGKVYADYVKSRFDSSGNPKAPTVYVGSNDGMLHAFNATTGAHRWAYMPSPSIAKLGKRADPLAGHQWFVDGPIVTHDVNFGSGWRTILVASTGAGARGLFALDVTDPNTPSLLWEWFPSSTDDPDAGFVTGEPVIARAANGKWIVAFGNGYGSVSNRAALIVLDAQTGTKVRSNIAVPTQSTTEANGLSSPALLYLAGKRLAFAYAGDLHGYVWKFDLSNATDPTLWGVGFGNKALFRATGPGGAAQPITAKMRVASDRQLGRILLFGTGRLLTHGDPAVTEVQTIYGIFDRDDAQPTVARSDLTAQTILSESATVRQVSSNPLPAGSAGWYLDLNYTSGGVTTTSGERVTMAVNYMPEVTLMTVSTLRPTAASDPCGSNVTSWVMAMSPFNGRGVQLFDSAGVKGAGWRLDDVVAAPTPLRKGSGRVALNVNTGAGGLAQIQFTQGWNPRASWVQVR